MLTFHRHRVANVIALTVLTISVKDNTINLNKSMKKLLFTSLLSIITLICNAQIYSKIEYLDKFDDIIKNENIKTLITKTDSTFTVEVKGHKPIEYWILNYAEFNSMGDEDNIVDLTGKNVYGYQDCWCVINISDKEEYYNLFNKVILEGLNVDVLQKYWLFIVHRVISRYSFKFEYKNEFFWIQNDLNDNKLGKDISRIIYTND